MRHTVRLGRDHRSLGGRLLTSRAGGWRRRALGVALSVAFVGCVVSPAVVGASTGRHFEQVSPAEKGGGDIVGEWWAIVASEAGDGVTFDSRLVFGDAVGSGVVGRTTYLARRFGGAWSTRSITPMPRPEAVQVFFASTKVQVFSEDLSTALVWGYDLPTVTGDAPDRMNLYAQDTATGLLRPISVSQVDRLALTDFLDPNIWGVSADAKHVAFVTATQMLPEAEPFVPNVYKWDDGVLSVAGVLPDGSVPDGGTTIEPMNARGTMSADGSRLVFLAPADFSAPLRLYLRVNGERTAWVSQPEGSDESDPAGVSFQGMTPDGRNVFFVSDSPLLDEDTAPGPDLYRYTDSANPADDANLTLITDDGGAENSPFTGGPLVGMSDDGRRVYVHKAGGELSVWDDGVLRTIDPAVTGTAEPRDWLSLMAYWPGNGRVSPDGNWLAFLAEGDMYVYSLKDDELTCASCPSGASLVPTVTNSGRLEFAAFRPRFLSEDGQVFFHSTGALVPEDTNGVADVYEFDGQTGALRLLSSGRGSEPSMFADASSSGDDVFFVTRQQLAGSDRDDYVDLYDARVGAAPPDLPLDSPACEGDACQGALSGAPADDLVGSVTFDGADGGGRRAALIVGRRASFRGLAGVLRAKVGGAGRLKWRGRGLVAGAVRRGSAGTVRLRLRLDRRARARLRRSGRYATTVHLTFLAADGTRATRAIRVTSAVAKKGR